MGGPARSFPRGAGFAWARTRPSAWGGAIPASGTGWRGSAAAPAWSPRPSARWTPRSRCSSASAISAGSTNSYLCWPKTPQHFTETHEMGLFSDDHFRAAFAAAGMVVAHDEKGLMDRGLYIGTWAAPNP